MKDFIALVGSGMLMVFILCALWIGCGCPRFWDKEYRKNKGDLE